MNNEHPVGDITGKSLKDAYKPINFVDCNAPSLKRTCAWHDICASHTETAGL